MGYRGIHMDRRGYPDDGRAIETALKTALGVEPIVSLNGRDVFFTLVPFSRDLDQSYATQDR
jgi:phosphoglycerol transferase